MKALKRYVIRRLPGNTNLMGPAQPNCYNICVTYPGHEMHLRDDFGRLSVTFCSNHADARLPNPKLLALHAACARVVHMSGAEEAFDDPDPNAEPSDESE